MKTSLVSLLAASCLATILIAAEPDTTPAPAAAPTPLAQPAQPDKAPADATSSGALATPSPSPAHHHRRHHAAPAASPTPSATPVKKLRWWQHKPEAKASPSQSPAAATPRPSTTPKPPATPSPTPKSGKSARWWKFHLFKSHGKAVPQASASPSASPGARKRHKTPHPAASPGSTPEGTPASSATPGPTATPEPEASPMAEAAPTPKEEHKSTGLSEQVPFVPSGAPDQPVVETKSPVEQEADETRRFQAAKAKAMLDTHVQDLQAKADAASGDDVKPASVRYYKALYSKMREIDPSVADRIKRTEAATMRRLNQEGQEGPQ